MSRVPPREATLPRGQRGSQWRQRGLAMRSPFHAFAKRNSHSDNWDFHRERNVNDDAKAASSSGGDFRPANVEILKPLCQLIPRSWTDSDASRTCRRAAAISGESKARARAVVVFSERKTTAFAACTALPARMKSSAWGAESLVTPAAWELQLKKMPQSRCRLAKSLVSVLQ